jgi:hypothetical protein
MEEEEEEEEEEDDPVWKMTKAKKVWGHGSLRQSAYLESARLSVQTLVTPKKKKKKQLISC